MPAPVFVDGVTPLNAASFNALGAEVNTKLTAPAVVNGQWIKGVGGAAVWSAITPADVGLPKITTSTLAGGPPGGPADGDIWIATAVDTLGTRWMFQYDAAWASDASKWKFVGGPPVETSVGSVTIVSAVYADLASGPTFTVVRAGAYLFEAAAQYAQPNTLGALVSMAVGNAGSPIVFANSGQAYGANAFLPLGRAGNTAVVAAGFVAKIQSAISAGTCVVAVPQLYVTPVRIT